MLTDCTPSAQHLQTAPKDPTAAIWRRTGPGPDARPKAAKIAGQNRTAHWEVPAMEIMLTSLVEALAYGLDPYMLMIILAGVIWGSGAGALPGITSVIAIGVMVPFTFGLPPIYAVAFLISINVGCSFGNSIPAILVGLPGTPSAVLTAMDGYALHKKGQTGLALGVTFYASVMGQFVSIFLFLLMVVPLSGLTYVFLSPEMFALYFLGITAIISITSENILKGLLSAAFGLLIAMVGRDPLTSISRFDFGNAELRGGIEISAAVVGLLAVSELFRSMRQSFSWDKLSTKFDATFPPLRQLLRVTPAVGIGTLIGGIIGAVPGVSGTASAVISYQQSKFWSKRPQDYGKGSIEGIAANESAQNASQAGEMVPTFGLGIPSGGAMVILLGALLIHGFVPGPMMIREAPELLHACVAGLLGATIFLAVIGWPIGKALVYLVRLDRTMVLVGALGLTMLGIFTINRSVLEVFLMLGFGVVGYFMLRYGYSVAGASLAAVLGAGMENNLRSGLLLQDNSVWQFVSRPWTGGVLLLSLAFLTYGTVTTVKTARKAAEARRQAARAAQERGQ
jgi:putative tricarboxylic transport membrane protein